MVTGVQEQIPRNPFLVSKQSAFLKIIASLQCKNPCDNQGGPNFADLQQLLSNRNTADFKQYIITITELPKSLTSGVPIYYSKCENFKLFADLFQRNRRIHNQVIDENNRNYNQYLMRGDALQTFRKNQQPIQKSLVAITAVFLRKHVKSHFVATAKHNDWKLICNRANQN